MLVKNNYDECLTDLACSIRRYFGLKYNHNTLKYIDKILDTKKPKNVVVILFDGMGYRILNRVLDENSFFIKKYIKKLQLYFQLQLLLQQLQLELD